MSLALIKINMFERIIKMNFTQQKQLIEKLNKRIIELEECFITEKLEKFFGYRVAWEWRFKSSSKDFCSGLQADIKCREKSYKINRLGKFQLVIHSVEII